MSLAIYKYGLYALVLAGLIAALLGYRASLINDGRQAAQLECGAAALKQTVDDQAAHIQQLTQQRDDARARAQAAVDLTASIEQEKDRVQKDADAARAELRAGQRKLRQQFTCAAPAAAGMPGAAAGELSAGAGGLQPEHVDFLDRESRRADSVALELKRCAEQAAADRAPWP